MNDSQAERMRNQNSALTKPGPTWEELIKEREDKFVSALANNKPLAMRFANHMLMLINSQPELAKCKPSTVFHAALSAAGLNLMPNVVNECWILPYKIDGVPKAQFQIGYKGYVKLFYRSGLAKLCWHGRIYEGDDKNIKQHVEGHGGKVEDDSRPLIGWYAAYELTTGGIDYLPLTLAQIERYRKTSKAPSSPAWTKWYDEMCIKTCYIHLLKYAPLETDIAAAIELDGGVREYDDKRDRDVNPAAMALKADFTVDDTPPKQAPETQTELLDTANLGNP